MDVSLSSLRHFMTACSSYKSLQCETSLVAPSFHFIVIFFYFLSNITATLKLANLTFQKIYFEVK